MAVSTNFYQVVNISAEETATAVGFASVVTLSVAFPVVGLTILSFLAHISTVFLPTFAFVLYVFAFTEDIAEEARGILSYLPLKNLSSQLVLFTRPKMVFTMYALLMSYPVIQAYFKLRLVSYGGLSFLVIFLAWAMHKAVPT